MTWRDRRPVRTGVTLLELVVALVLIGVFMSVVPHALRAPRRAPNHLTIRVDSMREAALRSGRPQHAYLRDGMRYGEVLALPTGAVVADSTLRLDVLTGAPRP